MKNKFHYIKIFWEILKKSKLIFVILLFIIFYFIFTTIIYFIEPTAFNDYGDALWFTFISFFTVGYGDYTVKTIWARIFTVFLVIYGAVIIAIFTAIWVNMIIVITKAQVFNEEEEIYNKLCNLDKLHKDDLTKLSNFFKGKKKKNKIEN